MLKDHLQKAAGKKISLTITDNSASIISARTRGDVLHVRLHHMFLSSDEDIVDELAAFIRGKESKTPLVREFIRRQSGLLKKTVPRPARVCTQGKYHDLLALAGFVNREYFGGRITAPVTWGTARRGRAVRRRTLGSYSSHTNTIRINPVLDKKKVPQYFIEFIVYHEMLHADLGVEAGTKRRSVHTREFRRREKIFKKYAESMAWEKDMNFSM